MILKKIIPNINVKHKCLRRPRRTVNRVLYRNTTNISSTLYNILSKVLGRTALSPVVGTTFSKLCTLPETNAILP